MLKKLTALLSLCCATAFAETELSAKMWLAQMPKAQAQSTYEMTFVQTTPNNIDALRYRQIMDTQKYAQLITLDGVPQEIVQRYDLISYFQPHVQPITISGKQIIDNLPAIWWANFDILEKYYDFINIGRNRVADRIVQTIRILPKDDFRYQYVAFIDEETRLLMRSDLLDRDGNLLEQFRVITLNTEKSSDLTTYLDNLALPPFLIEKNEQPATSLQWQPSWLPQGFTAVTQSREAEGQQQVESQLYSDGLFSFTLYVSDPIAKDLDNVWKQGAYTIYSETIGDKEITFIGQLPLSTAKRIVQDIKFH